MAAAKKPPKKTKVMSVTLLPGEYKEIQKNLETRKKGKFKTLTVNRNSVTGISQKLSQGGEYYVAKRAPKPKLKPEPPKTERTMRAKAAAKKARLGRDGKTK